MPKNDESEILMKILPEVVEIGKVKDGIHTCREIRAHSFERTFIQLILPNLHEMC